MPSAYCVEPDIGQMSEFRDFCRNYDLHRMGSRRLNFVFIEQDDIAIELDAAYGTINYRMSFEGERSQNSRHGSQRFASAGFRCG